MIAKATNIGSASQRFTVVAKPLQEWTKGKPMKISRNDFAAAIVVGAVLLLGSGAATTQQSSPPLSSQQIAQIVASPDRSEADRTNDLRRKPEQMLGFIGIRAGIVALDLSAAGGYTTELLARAIGPSGAVYGQSRPHGQTAAPPPAPEGNSNPSATPSAAPATPAPARRPSPVALAERDGKLRSAGVPASPIVAVSRPFEDPVPPELAAERIDLVTLMFNYHDLGHLGVDRATMNQAVFRAQARRSLCDRRSFGPAWNRHLRIRHPASYRGSVSAAGGRSRGVQAAGAGEFPAQPE
jgi:hypothetical protein